MRLRAAAIALLACSFTAFPALAAGAQTPTGTGVYFVHTGTTEGTCEVEPGLFGAREIRCKDGPNEARYREGQGCLESRGSGYCALGLEWAPGRAGAQLNCANGYSFQLTAASGRDTRCSTRRGVKTCVTTDGSGMAQASCSQGCLRTEGPGLCCKVGTPGCPPR